MDSTDKDRVDTGWSQMVMGDANMVGQSTMALVGEDDAGKRPKELWGSRHTLAFLGFLGFAVVYAMRVNLSVAIVAMVKYNPSNSTVNDSQTDVCQPPDDYDPQDSEDQEGEFDWDETVQGQILGCFFFGYLFTNVLGGRAAEYFGGKKVMGLGILLTAILTLLSPICARASTGAFIAIRVLEGVTEGVTFPAMNVMLATWVPPLERSKFSSLVYAGVQFGTVITLTASGWLCETDFLGGWPSVFYVFGALGVLWSMAWFLLAHDNPATHPRISDEEKRYILHHIGARRSKPLSVPWISIFNSLPVWSLIVVHFGNNWGFYTLLTELPTYLKNIQHYDMKSSGFMSALPYLIMWLFSLVYSNIMDRLLKAHVVSIIFVRKLSNVIGLYGPMVGLIAMCFVDCNTTLAMVVLCLAVGLNGSIYSGYMCSHQDLSPNFAGSLMGLTNTVATIPGMMAPSVTGAIINGNQTLSAWRTVFLIATGTYLVSNIGYLFFMKAEAQPWNNVRTIEDAEQEKKRY